ncbi:origin recognition complex subunit 4-like isoform X2 [Paramacrobiotus metropolitanus]|uniref:origin recognition complex subunit 4-like isoform X2 n=1 Tax=Paramacrobiotus metropolitanus TaxID=2943436 RepID=UPI002445EF4E|nr:origin recognition complex subunit 4-like isoform X2 [Paramacrobiotus metropolitanus]
MPPQTKKRRGGREVDIFLSVASKKCVEQLDAVLKRVFCRGSRESVILCGPSGCGKSTVLEQALQIYRDDSDLWNTFHHIRLDGWTQAGDSRTCVDEILLQVGAGRQKNDGGITGSLAEKLLEMGRILTDVSQKENKSGFLIIIDQLEGLAEQKTQLILYTLLDLVFTSTLAVCVIGMTTVLDVMERMEKRVRSRFSNRIINVGAEIFAGFDEFCHAFVFRASCLIDELAESDVAEALKEGTAVQSLEKAYEERGGWNTINQLSLLVASFCENCGSRFTAKHIVQAVKMILEDRTVDVIRDLPHLHFALLLCCFQFTRTHQTRNFNYCLVEEIYSEATKMRLRNLKFGQHLLMQAFSDLVDYGLLKFVDRVKDEPWKYRSVTLGMALQHIRGAVGEIDMTKMPTDLRAFCSEVLR